MVSTRTGSIVVLAAGLVAVAAAPAPADVVIGENNQTGTRDCGGGIATVNGNSNTISLRNCAKLAVNGNNNVLDAGPVEALSLLGNGNRVTWAPGPGGRAAKISDLGSRNEVSQGTASRAEASKRGGRAGGGIKVEDSGDTTVKVEKGSVTIADRDGKGGVTVSGPGGKVVIDDGGVVVGGSRRSGRAGDLVIAESEVTKTHDCGGGSVVVDGGDNVLTFRNCNDVTINGGSNQVTVSGASSIRILGAENNVIWRPGPDGRRPRIVTVGTGNTVTQSK